MLNTILAALIIFSGPVTFIIFICKWVETDFETAWNIFETFIEENMK